MAEPDELGDKEQPATQRRLEKAREAGSVPLSREAVNFAVLAAVTAILVYQEPNSIRAGAQTLSRFIGSGYDRSLLASFGRETLTTVVEWLVDPILIAGGLAGATAVLAQTRMLIRTQSVAPDLSRVHPISGLKRLFGFRGVTELLKSVAKLTIAAAVLGYAVREEIPVFGVAPRYDVHQLPDLLGRVLLRVLLAGLMAQAIISVADFVWMHFKFHRDLRMSKQQIRNEYKETEGNPIIKGHLRSIAKARLKNNIRRAVPRATVVITNPTHYAVALAYESGTDSAPKVVAKGADILAAEIRRVARDHNVPTVENPPLARALYRLEVEAEVPEEHYKAVAEIIAFIWRLRSQWQSQI